MLARYSSIFSALVLLFIATAAVEQFQLSGVVVILSFLLVAVSGVYVASGSKKWARVSIAAATLWILLMGLHNRLGTYGLLTASSVGGILYIGLTVRIMLRHIFRSRQVHADLLFGAAAVYLMFALLWTFIYSAIEELTPGAFGSVDQSFFALLYFSLTTLTTLGYGDIVPKVPLAQIAAVLESAVGVLYTGIMVARLLGLHISERSEN